MNTASFHALDYDALAHESFHLGFDRKPFAFRHSLRESGLFSLPCLLELALRRTVKPGCCYVEEGDIAPGDGWGGEASNLSLVERIQGIDKGRSLVLLKRVHEDEAYRQVFLGIQEDLSNLSGIDMGGRYRDAVMSVILASPGRITPYHVDGEANLLMQIAGMKSVYVFDGNSREVLPSGELERFWAGDIHAPMYRRHLQDQAREFQIGPGDGVSFPVAFPHWVQNGPQVSISVSVNFKRAADAQADSYKVNHRLRKLGLNPLEPGNLKVIDNIKGLAYQTAARVKRYIAAT